MTAAFNKRLLLYAALYAGWLSLLFVATGGLDAEHWWMSWIRWDSEQYQEIWARGYAPPDLRLLTHPPGYSLLIGMLSTLTPFGFYMMARLVNIAAYFVSMVVAAELIARLKLTDKPLFLFLLALTFPPGYFVLSGYSDAVYNLLFWATLFIAIVYPEGRRAGIAEFFLLLAGPWVRLTGYAFAAWVLLRRWTAAAVFISLVGWLALNKHITDDAKYFISAQQQYNMPKGNFIDGARNAYWGIRYFNGGNWQELIHYNLLPVVYLVALFASALWFCWKRQPLIGLVMLAVLFLSHNEAVWRAVVRYDWPMAVCMFVPPLYSTLHKTPSNPSRRLTYLLLVVAGLLQLALQVHFANVFRQGGYAWG